MHPHNGRLRRAGRAGLVALAQALVAMAVAATTAATGAPGATAQTAPAEPEVTVTELVPLPGIPPVDRTKPYDVNDHGQVVGESDERPVLWEDGQPTELPLRGDHLHMATHINDRGDVVVQHRWYEGGSAPRYGAYVWRDGQVTDLNAGSESVSVIDLNESGQALLQRNRNGVVSHELWQDGSLTDLRLPPPADEQQGIKLLDLSDGGHVIGEYGQTMNLWTLPVWVATGGIWRWHAGSFDRVTTFTPFGALGRAVNQQGQVVGSDLAGGLRWSGGRTTRLGFEPEDVNDRGQVVGMAGSQPVVWLDGRRTDLGLFPGSDYTRPLAINERGQVLGYATVPDAYHTFLWTDGHMVDLGRGEGPGADYTLDDLNDEGQAIGTVYGGAGPKAVMWTIHDDGGPVDPPPDGQCVTATNQAHVQAGRATSWLTFTWAAGSGTYIGLSSQTTSLREATPGRWEPVMAC